MGRCSKQAWNFTEATGAMASVALVLALVPFLNVPLDYSDILMEVPLLKTKWPCPFKKEIPRPRFKGIISSCVVRRISVLGLTTTKLVVSGLNKRNNDITKVRNYLPCFKVTNTRNRNKSLISV